MTSDAAAARNAKERVFEFYGARCARCGFTDTRALQIDHREGGGVRQLRKSGNRRWYYRYVLRHPEAYQLLCANCNWIKRAERGEHNGHFNTGRYKGDWPQTAGFDPQTDHKQGV